MRSALQRYEHHLDGTITVEGQPGITLDTIHAQGLATGRDIEAELGLPQYFEEWEALAAPRGLSRRRVRFIVLDESVTSLPGSPRLQPRQIALPGWCALEFAHRGFLIGTVDRFYLGVREHWDALACMGFEIPTDVTGDCLLAEAQLFNSPLADKAWEALQRGIFTHVCPLIFRKDTEPPGTGQLLEVSLTDDSFPGCPGARIITSWEA